MTHDMVLSGLIISACFCYYTVSTQVIAHEKLCLPSWYSFRYNEVVHPGAHNAQSHKTSPVCNQDMPVDQQLKAGVRALKVHVWYTYDNRGKRKAIVCHGLKRDFLEKDYLEHVVEKVPKIIRPFARKVLADLTPINEIVRTACQAAYGTDTKPGLIPFPHGIFDPATRDLATFLAEVRSFTRAHPHEIITIILEDHTNDLDLLAMTIQASGLARLAHSQNIHKAWPTLEQMVAAHKPLVFFVQNDTKLAYNRYSWLHDLWSFAWDTEWDFQTVQELCDEKKDIFPKRGTHAFEHRTTKPGNKLFIVHHFVTQGPGGSKTAAKKVNRKAFLKKRLMRLAHQAHHVPNIVQLDYCELPKNDLFDVVNEFNSALSTHNDTKR